MLQIRRMFDLTFDIQLVIFFPIPVISISITGSFNTFVNYQPISLVPIDISINPFGFHFCVMGSWNTFTNILMVHRLQDLVINFPGIAGITILSSFNTFIN